MVGALATVASSVAVAVDPARRRAGPEFEGRPQAVAVVVLAAIADAVAVGVGAARMHPGDVFLPVGQAVAVGVLAPVGEAVAVRVGAGRAGQRVGALPGVREAVAVGVGRRGRGGRRQQAGDEQDGRERDPRVTTTRAIHAPIVRRDGVNGECLGRPGPPDPVVRFRLATPATVNLFAGATIC